ncbi:extracellular solute-binding protein [Paenibacillus sp. LHD-117]|uniref:extracellular solute-binding protein n=1 Tax=Paenibacillus sp. LHD-117 TaxID=3071412 RepID=UPI0027E11153|nr:extracellular solute-binding protein [Paenibacillus sp. LHD-117]MDQ6418742.1 extracellular solute-binding protein [Paenibacillus sp. LHD-117]
MPRPKRPITAALRKLALTLLPVLVLCVSCVQDDSKPGSGDAGDKPEISIMAPLHFPHPPSDETMSVLEELTGTELEINWVPDGIYTDKMNTALTTNSLKKVTFAKHTDYMFMKNAIRSGAFWEIGPYLDRFPNLRHLDEGILSQTAVDGKLYGLYTERPSSRQGIIIREDWLDALGLEKPDTLEELYEVIRLFTQNDPDRNGQADTFGLADRNDLVFGAFKTLSSYFGAPNNWGVEGEGGAIVPEFESPAYLDAMNFMKQLYDEGLINRDFAVTSKEMQRDFIIRGEAGVYIGSMQDVQRLSDEAKQFNPEARFALVNRIEGPAGYRVWSIPNYFGLYLFSKKAIRTEEELLDILAFYDRTMDKDVANVLRYGIEDKHYKLKDGKVLLPEETTQLRTTEAGALYVLMIADLSNPNVLDVSEQETLQEEAERYTEDNEKFIVPDPTNGLESKTYDEKGVELYKIISDATYNYMLGKLDADGFYAQVEQWKRQGGAQIVQEYRDAYNTR